MRLLLYVSGNYVKSISLDKFNSGGLKLMKTLSRAKTSYNCKLLCTHNRTSPLYPLLVYICYFTECQGLEGTLRDHLVQSPCRSRNTICDRWTEHLMASRPILKTAHCQILTPQEVSESRLGFPEIPIFRSSADAQTIMKNLMEFCVQTQSEFSGHCKST